MSTVKKPNSIVFYISILILLLFAFGCSKTSSPTPTVAKSDPTQMEPSFTPLPSKTPIPTNTPSPTDTPAATLTPTSSTGDVIEGDYGPYPQITPANLYAKPGDYVGKKLMFKGILLSYGYKQIDGKQTYVLQVGVKEYPRPIIVLGFEPNPRLATRDGIIIGGTGGGSYSGLYPDVPEQVTPVITGEWYECNMPLDQMEYPRDYWIPIP